MTDSDSKAGIDVEKPVRSRKEPVTPDTLDRYFENVKQDFKEEFHGLKGIHLENISEITDPDELVRKVDEYRKKRKVLFDKFGKKGVRTSTTGSKRRKGRAKAIQDKALKKVKAEERADMQIGATVFLEKVRKEIESKYDNADIALETINDALGAPLKKQMRLVQALMGKGVERFVEESRQGEK